MNAIEIINLKKNFHEKHALCGLNMIVPENSIYGFIGENGSGKSTTEKIICGLVQPSSGEIKIFGKDYRDEQVRSSIGVLIENTGCYPNMSVWTNLLLQATNLNLKNKKEEVRKILKLVRMEGSASNKFKNCSLGMKQRIGIAMALLGNPKLLVLDEPINGLDADGVRILRDILRDIVKTRQCTVLISSHILGELEKIATHYGIIRGGKMITQMTAQELDENCPRFVRVESADIEKTKILLNKKYERVEVYENEIRVYGGITPQEVVDYLYKNGIIVTQLGVSKISLEEYYIGLMKKEEGK